MNAKPGPLQEELQKATVELRIRRRAHPALAQVPSGNPGVFCLEHIKETQNTTSKSGDIIEFKSQIPQMMENFKIQISNIMYLRFEFMFDIWILKYTEIGMDIKQKSAFEEMEEWQTHGTNATPK